MPVGIVLRRSQEDPCGERHSIGIQIPWRIDGYVRRFGKRSILGSRIGRGKAWKTIRRRTRPGDAVGAVLSVGAVSSIVAARKIEGWLRAARRGFCRCPRKRKSGLARPRRAPFQMVRFGVTTINDAEVLAAKAEVAGLLTMQLYCAASADVSHVADSQSTGGNEPEILPASTMDTPLLSH